MNKGRNTLMASGNFGVCAIDNTQIMTPRKYQCGGVSSKMNMYTTRLFFKVARPTNLDAFRFNHTRPAITYVDQILPCPIGMPLYNLTTNITAANFEPQSFPTYVTVHTNDGENIRSYMKHFEISQIAASFRKLIPHNSRDSSSNGFNYQLDQDVKKMYHTRLPMILDANCKTTGTDPYSYYKMIKEFPYRATEKWRGNTDKASIIVQP